MLWIQAAKIPGPPSPSFFGHSQLFSRESLTGLLSDSHDRYGSVVKLWLGPTQLLVSVKDPTLFKEMLLKAEDKLPLTGRAFRLAFGPCSLFASSFDKVQKRRESLAVELNGRLLEKANVFPAKAMDCIMERVNKNMCKESVDCKMVSQHMAFTLLGTILFGDAFLTWSKANIYEELLMMIAKDACLWASYGVAPFWKRGFWRYQCLCTKLKCLTQDIIHQCKKNYKLFRHANQNNHDEITTAMESAFSTPSCSSNSLQEFSSHLFTKEEPCGNIMVVMFHGCLTTAGLIGNILARLATHPEIQDSIYSEIVMAQKCSVDQDKHDVDKMLLLLATIYESARLLSSGPLLQRCSLKHDLSFENGLTIPAGAVLVVPVQLVQVDNSKWGSDASKFNPYRFLSKEYDLLTDEQGAGKEDKEHSSFVLKDPNDNEAFLSFGFGTRACLGQKFVIQGVATLFASLLERYEIKLQPESKHNPEPARNNNVFQTFPNPDIVFVKRNS